MRDSRRLATIGIALVLGFFVATIAIPTFAQTVSFTDQYLEAAIRTRIGKPTGSLQHSDLRGLSYLGLVSTDITNLEGIQYCVDLTTLEITAFKIEDLSPLASLTNLTTLRLYSCVFIRDISPLASLTNLTTLMMGSCSMEDISPLASLTNLTTLDLSDSSIRDLSPLASLTNLTTLDLSDASITHFGSLWDISPLANLINLSTLDLSDNVIRDISPLANLINLTTLDLSANIITDISPLANLTKLTTLDLGRDWTMKTLAPVYESGIIDLSPLANLTNLTTLQLYDNYIGDISPLANLINLTTLGLSDNYIRDLSPFIDNPEFGLRNSPCSIDLSTNCLETALPGLRDMASIDVLRDRGIVFDRLDWQRAVCSEPEPKTFVRYGEFDYSALWRWSENPSQKTVAYTLTLTLHNIGLGPLNSIQLWVGLYTGPNGDRVWDQTKRNLGNLEAGETKVIVITLHGPMYESTCPAFRADAMGDYPPQSISKNSGCR